MMFMFLRYKGSGFLILVLILQYISLWSRCSSFLTQQWHILYFWALLSQRLPLIRVYIMSVRWWIRVRGFIVFSWKDDELLQRFLFWSMRRWIVQVFSHWFNTYDFISFLASNRWSKLEEMFVRLCLQIPCRMLLHLTSSWRFNHNPCAICHRDSWDWWVIWEPFWDSNNVGWHITA